MPIGNTPIASCPIATTPTGIWPMAITPVGWKPKAKKPTGLLPMLIHPLGSSPTAASHPNMFAGPRSPMATSGQPNTSPVGAKRPSATAIHTAVPTTPRATAKTNIHRQARNASSDRRCAKGGSVSLPVLATVTMLLPTTLGYARFTPVWRPRQPTHCAMGVRDGPGSAGVSPAQGEHREREMRARRPRSQDVLTAATKMPHIQCPIHPVRPLE